VKRVLFFVLSNEPLADFFFGEWQRILTRDGSSRVNDAFLVLFALPCLSSGGGRVFPTAHEIPLAIDQFFLFVEYMFYFYDTSGSLNSEYDSELSVSVTRET
jgi:hypothetical protein